MRDSSNLWKQTMLVRGSNISFFFFNVFFFYVLNSNTQTVQLHVCYLIIHFKVIFAPLVGLEMRVTQIFLLLFHNTFFFVYQLSDLEGSCSNGI